MQQTERDGMCVGGVQPPISRVALVALCHVVEVLEVLPHHVLRILSRARGLAIALRSTSTVHWLMLNVSGMWAQEMLDGTMQNACTCKWITSDRLNFVPSTRSCQLPAGWQVHMRTSTRQIYSLVWAPTTRPACFYRAVQGMPRSTQASSLRLPESSPRSKFMVCTASSPYTLPWWSESGARSRSTI